jgi:hypothetical protein
MSSQIDLSICFQKSLERKLSGLALAHPLEGIDVFRRIDVLMLDEISRVFLKSLTRREREIKKIKPDAQVQLAACIAIGVNPAALLDGLNQTGGYSEYEEFAYPEIFQDLELRISDQVVLRRALPDQAKFVDCYLRNRYASR